MKKDLASIIIPTYRRPELLKKAVKSALDQTYEPKEVIVVDDNSDNETEIIVKDFYSDKIKYIKNQSPGAGAAARNTGIKNAEGEFIAFLDDDDIWYDNKLKLQIDRLKENDENVLCTCGLKVVYQDKDLKYYNFPSLDDITFEKLLLNNKVGITSTVTVRKSALERSGYFDVSFPAREEYELWIRLSRTGKMVSVNIPLLDYLMHSGRKQISSDIEKFIRANQMIREKYEAEFSAMPSKCIRELGADNLFQYSTIAINNRKQFTAVKYIFLSLTKKFSLQRAVILLTYLSGFRTYIFLKQIYGKKLLRKYSGK